jgi:hypothetical protein
VQRALEITRRGLGVDIGGPWYDWSHSYQPDRFERAALHVHTSTSGYATKAATGLWAIKGYRERFAYAAALALPSRAYLRERDGSYRKRVTRSVRLAREWKRNA